MSQPDHARGAAMFMSSHLNLLAHYAIYVSSLPCLNKPSPLDSIVVPRTRLNLVTESQLRMSKMFQSELLADVDEILSQVNVMLSNANRKLSMCQDPVKSRNFILSRVQHILEEVQWTVSLSEEDVSSDSSSTSPDVTMEWDDYEEKSFYQTVFINEETEDDDHGQCSDSSDVSSAEDSDSSFSESLLNSLPPLQSPLDPVNFRVKVSQSPTDPNRVVLTPVLRKPKTGPPLPVSSSDEDEDDEMSNVVSTKFIEDMSAKIKLLAPDGVFKVARPVEYKIDLSKVNYSFRVRNIPDPFLYPVLGCSQDPNFYDLKYRSKSKRNYYTWDTESREYPHGGLYGYNTDVGIVPVPEEPVHGYVFKHGRGWVLHAEVDNGTPFGDSWFQPKKRGRLRS